MRDSAMTIEYLRARLLSERSVSRSAKQRADELAERVMELEEQLKIVYLQRKKTEKATADVLAILGSLGISDDSEGFDPSSDQESTHPQACYGNCLDKNKDKSRSMDQNGFEPTTYSCRSLSWNSSRCSSDCERKSAPSRRRSSFLSSDFLSPKHHAGKSCRQIKRREIRSTADEFSENEAKSESQIAGDDFKLSNHNCDCQIEKLSARDALPICKTSPREMMDSEPHFFEHEEDGEMERALKHQAELINRYEAEENAQIEWEEKYKERNSSTPESVEPGSQSDVTEERDELRGQPACYRHLNEDANAQVKDALTNEVSGTLSNEDDVQRQPSPQTTVSPPKSENGDSVAFSHTSHPEDATPMNKAEKTQDKSSSEINANYCKGETSKATIRKSVRVPLEASKDLESVLEALQRAKLSLQHKLRKLPLTEDGFIVKAGESHHVPARAQMPASGAGLFWVPTNPKTEENVCKSYSDSRSHSSLMDRNHESTSPASLTDHIEKPRGGVRVTMSNASNDSSFDFSNNWKTALSSLCNGDDYTRSPSVLSERGFSNSDRYKLSPHFGTPSPRSSFTGSDGHAQSPLPDLHFGFLTNDFAGSRHPLTNNRSSIFQGDLHAQGLHANSPSPSSSDHFARNPYSNSSPAQLLFNTSSGSSQPFPAGPNYSRGPDISLSSNDWLLYSPSHISIPDLSKPAAPTFGGFPSHLHHGN